MNVLVAYATRYGSTAQIAQFIADRLQAEGLRANAESVETIGDVHSYDAFVVGSAVYMGHWLKPAVDFVRRNSGVLAERATWIFSSGPLGPSTTQGQQPGGDDPEPAEITQLRDAIRPRGHAIFDGVLNPQKLSLGHKAVRALPAARALMPEGDFRQWRAIESWATEIARHLRAVPVLASEP